MLNVSERAWRNSVISGGGEGHSEGFLLTEGEVFSAVAVKEEGQESSEDSGWLRLQEDVLVSGPARFDQCS
eukprot:4976960-Amphidinium_carterae.1